MQTEVDLDRATTAGIINESQAIALRKLEAEHSGISLATSEKFHLFGGANDVMIALGLSMLLYGLFIFSQPNIFFYILAAPALFFLGKKIHMRTFPFTSMVILIGFIGPLFFTLTVVFPFESRSFTPMMKWVWVACVGSLPAFVGGWFFWKSFRFPPTPAVLALIATFTFAYFFDALFRSEAERDFFILALSTFLLSLLVLAYAIWWDITDIRRETERSQVAFWLHCAAGFLIGQSSFALIGGTNPMEGYGGMRLRVEHSHMFMITCALFAITSLILDRRSLLLGAAVTAILFFTTALRYPGMIPVGLAILVISWGWRPLRRVMLSMLPTKLVAQLPRTEISHSNQRPTRQHLDFLSRKIK